MRRLAQKVWIGIGVAALTSAGAAPAAAQHGHHGAKSKAPVSADSGALAKPQSGEAYLTDGGPKDTRIRIYRDIALMRGHLIVGGELVEQGRWDEALPHFLHPTEELYGAMERYIKLHKVTPFDRQLKQLAQSVKARNKAAHAQAAKVVDERLDDAMTVFKRFMRGAPFTSFTARTSVEVLKVAASEYEASIENGKFTKPVEYQDSRGFVLHVEQLLAKHASEFDSLDASTFADLRRLLSGLKTTWPTAVPPATPLTPPAEVSATVDAFEKLAMRFF